MRETQKRVKKEGKERQEWKRRGKERHRERKREKIMNISMMAFLAMKDVYVHIYF